jgi:hypothetical protein
VSLLILLQILDFAANGGELKREIKINGNYSPLTKITIPHNFLCKSS